MGGGDALALINKIYKTHRTLETVHDESIKAIKKELFWWPGWFPTKDAYIKSPNYRLEPNPNLPENIVRIHKHIGRGGPDPYWMNDNDINMKGKTYLPSNFWSVSGFDVYPPGHLL